MLTSVDVKFISVVHLYRKVKEIKFCSGQQIYSKYQMLSIALSSCCSCHVFRQYFAVKRVKCFSVNGSVICNLAALLTSLAHYDKILSKFGQR